MTTIPRKRVFMGVLFLVVMGGLLTIAFIGSQQKQVYRSRAYAEPTTPPPRTSPTPTPTSCSRKAEGDANCDSKVDGVDYSIWLNTQCNPGTSQTCADLRADFNGDKKVNDDDYNIWSTHRGT